MRKISPTVYNKRYFDSERCEGFAEYKKNKLSEIKKIEVSQLNLQKEDKILDIGCGRGDIFYYLSKRGYDVWATDYSSDAVDMTKKRVSPKLHERVFLSDARKNIIKNIRFEKIIIGDVIEHMTFKDALKLINNAYLMLADKGTLVVHTAPNLWFKKHVYPLIKIAFKLLRYKRVADKLDENIRGTYKYHVDEYSPRSLAKLMKKSNFKEFRIWVNRDAVRKSSVNYLDPIKKSVLFKILIGAINKSFLINFFGNDLFVVAKK